MDSSQTARSTHLEYFLSPLGLRASKISGIPAFPRPNKRLNFVSPPLSTPEHQPPLELSLSTRNRVRDVDISLGMRGDSRLWLLCGMISRWLSFRRVTLGGCGVREGGQKVLLNVDDHKSRMEGLGGNMLDPWVKMRRLASS